MDWFLLCFLFLIYLQLLYSASNTASPTLNVSSTSESIVSATVATAQTSSSTLTPALSGTVSPASDASGTPGNSTSAPPNVFTAPASAVSSITGCSGPPALCCPGHNNSCYRGCYCDEICVSFKDCCPDYNSTCTQSSTLLPLNLSSTTASTVSTTVTTARTSSNTVMPALNGTVSSVSDITASSPPGNSTSAPPNGLTKSESEVSSAIMTTDIRVLSSSEDEDAVIQEVLSYFQAFLQQSCNGCKMTIRHIKPPE